MGLVGMVAVCRLNEEKPVSIVFSSSEISLPVKRGRMRIAARARFCLRLATDKEMLEGD